MKNAATKTTNGHTSYIVNSGEIMILVNGKASGIVVDDYKKSSLKEAADALGTNEVRASIEYKGKYATVILDGEDYSIWSDGDCLFSN